MPKRSICTNSVLAISVKMHMLTTSALTQYPSIPAAVTESGQQQRVQLPGTSSAAIEVGGQGGSRAWVGNVRRRRKGKSVLRVDHQEDGGGALRSFRCSALDDKVEVL